MLLTLPNLTQPTPQASQVNAQQISRPPIPILKKPKLYSPYPDKLKLYPHHLSASARSNTLSSDVHLIARLARPTPTSLASAPGALSAINGQR